MSGAFFYPPPQPVQPTPHVPIGNQGQQPPKTNPAQAMATVLASWPTGLEHQPTQRPLKIAPLTLRYGDQPPVTSGQRDIDIMYASLIAFIPPDPLPTIPNRNYDVPLTLRYGDQPPVTSAMRDIDIFYAAMIAFIPPDPLPTLPNRGYVAPQTLVYGSQPPVTSAQRDIDLLYLTMGVAWTPPDPLPTLPNLRFIAPLTLVYGSQPPPVAGLRDVDLFYSQYELWRTPDPLPVQRPNLVPQAVVVVAQPPFARQPASILASWQSLDPMPTLNRSVAPLTLTYGDQPPMTSGLRDVDLFYSSLTAFIPPDPLPTLGNKYVWPTGTIQVDNPPRQSQVNVFTITRAWEPPDPPPVQKPLKVAPLTLVYGDQPPRVSRVNLSTVLSAWQVPEPVPVQVRFSPITVSAVVPFVPYPIGLIQSWQSDQSALPSQRKVAPLTLTYGDQPPTYSRVIDLIIRSWEPPPPPPTQKPLTVAPLTLTYGQQPPRQSLANLNQIVEQWTPPVPRFQTGIRTQIVSIDRPPLIPPTKFDVIMRSWLPPDPQPTQLMRTAVFYVSPIPVFRDVVSYTMTIERVHTATMTIERKHSAEMVIERKATYIQKVV